MITHNSQNTFSSIFLALATVFGLLLIFIASAFIFTSNNPVAKFALLVGGVLFLIGTVEPRRMIVALVPITFYLDEVKRFLIVLGRTDLEDVTSILAIAPMATGGILVGCVIRRIFFRRKGNPIERLAIIGALGAFIAFGGTDIFTAGNLLYGLKAAANSTVYFLLPWAMLQCFRTPEEIERFLKVSLMIGIPVALYGAWQYLVGMNQFEIAYMQSGLTSVGEINLADIHPRPFSTLSSPHPYTVLMSFMFALSVHYYSKWNNNQRSWKGLVMVAIYAIALALCMGRTAIISGIAMIAFARLFRSKTGMMLAYSVAMILIVGMVVFAEPLLASLDKIQSYLPMDSEWQQQAFRVGTWTDRLIGYNNILGNPSAWPLFANPTKYDWTRLNYSDADFTHDLFSQILLRIGAIPSALFAGLLIYVLLRAHYAILRLPDGKTGTRPLAARLMAIIVIFLISQLAGPGMTVFPINFWMGIFAGFLAIICIYIQKKTPVIHAPANVAVSVAEVKTTR